MSYGLRVFKNRIANCERPFGGVYPERSRRTQGRRVANSGFLLFEVMVTITVLSLGLIVVIRSFAASLDAARFAQNYTKAVMLAEEKMWELESGGTIDSDSPMAGELPGGFIWRLQTSPLEGDSTLKEVNLAISWKEKGRQEEVSLATYLKISE